MASGKLKVESDKLQVISCKLQVGETSDDTNSLGFAEVQMEFRELRVES